MAETNSLGRLHEKLFEELDRLGSIDVEDNEKLDAEVGRSKAIEGISKTIVENARVILDATVTRARLAQDVSVPNLLDG